MTNNSDPLKHQLRQMLTPERLLAVHHLKWPYAKRQSPNGTVVGYSVFRPSQEYLQAYYDLCFHPAILPMTKMPLDKLLEIDFTEFLPSPHAADYPEQCLGLITLLDQTRIYMTGYNFRYTRAFFDPICEKLSYQLISLPEELRPYGKQAWLSRGYSMDDWLVRQPWIIGSLVHSDKFMVQDRQFLKNWLHSMRNEVESYCGYADPFAPLEAMDDVDLDAFQRIEGEGPPTQSYMDPSKPASAADYAFWWIRIVNAHFSITDFAGHYPYWIRWYGKDWTKKDIEYMEATKWHRYNPAMEPVLQEVKADVQAGVWRSCLPNPKFEKQQ